MSILNEIETLKARVTELESLLGTGKKEYTAPTIVKSAPPHATPAKGKHRDIVLDVLQDGIPRHVGKIASDVSKAAGKKQRKDSINVICSSLYLDGKLTRPARGVYQKVS